MHASQPARRGTSPPARLALARDPKRDRHVEDAPGGELALLTRDLGRKVGAETAVLARQDRTARTIEVISSWGTADREEFFLPRGEGFVGRALESGRAAVEPINSEFDASLGAPASGVQLRFGGCAPVSPPAAIPGVLCAGFSRRPSDRALTVWTIESYARIAALCLSDPSALDGLAEAARQDPLTGVLNYGSSRAELSREVSRSTRHDLRFTLLFIDLDGFKQINDVHGHLHGNVILTRVAANLRFTVRECDTLGRFGGDEFMVILPETEPASAFKLAERLRVQVAATTDSVLPLTASIGAAGWVPGMTAEGLLAAADEALAAAKNAGGGVVVAATDLA